MTGKLLKAGLVLIAMHAGTASADYYSRERVSRSCQNQGQNTMIGIGLGAIIGGVVGHQTGRRNTVPGVVVGGLLGGLIGNSMSCRDQVEYVGRQDRYLDSFRYDNYDPYAPYDRRMRDYNGIRSEVIRSGYDRNGNLCHTYYQNVRGRYELVTACRVNNGWRHFQDPHIIADQRWLHPNPPPTLVIPGQWRNPAPPPGYGVRPPIASGPIYRNPGAPAQLPPQRQVDPRFQQRLPGPGPAVGQPVQRPQAGAPGLLPPVRQYNTPYGAPGAR